MDKSFGFNLNTSTVIDKDGKTSCGVSYKDSEGYNFRKDKKGEDASSVLTDLVNDFVGGYTEHLINTKAAEKAKEVAASTPENQEEKPKPQVSDALTKRLRELEEENRRLKAEKAAAEYKNGTRATTCATTSVPEKVSEKTKSESKPAKPIKKDENKELDAALSDFYAALDDFKKAAREFSIFDLF